MPSSILPRAFAVLRRYYWAVRGRHRFRVAGVSVDRTVRFYGLPYITIAPDSRVHIGSRVVLCSDSRYTALGVAKQIIIRTLRPGALICIGEDVGMSGTTICAALSVTIGNRCLLGADTVLADTDFHPVEPDGRRYAPIPKPWPGDRIVVGDDVFIGYGAVILKGVSIGRGSVIGARSVVTRDIPAYSIAAGVPARVIGRIESHGSS